MDRGFRRVVSSARLLRIVIGVEKHSGKQAKWEIIEFTQTLCSHPSQIKQPNSPTVITAPKTSVCSGSPKSTADNIEGWNTMPLNTYSSMVWYRPY